MAVGEPCTLINRTNKVLEVTMNGRVIKLKPGKNLATTDWIRFAKQQHPRMGTFDPSGMDGDYLVAVEGYDKPENCTMIAPGDEHHGNGVERFDRQHPDFDPEAATAEVVRTGIQPPKRRVPSEMSPLPADVTVSGALD